MGDNLDIDVEAISRRYGLERQKRLRGDGLAQYRRLEGAFEKLGEDPRVRARLKRDSVVSEDDVLIIGGGIGGLLVAARLREAGVKDIRIVDRAGDFGGTWYWNRYPGAACDVESYIYMPLLEETGYIPSEKYASAREIFAHCQRIGGHFDLYARALFQTDVTDAAWDEASRRWVVGTDRGDRLTARFVVSCKGLFTNPKMPNIPGIDQFEGAIFHTARWNYDYTGGDEDGRMANLADKAVGIIGTGSTGLQCVPALAAWARHLYVFQRTPASIDVRLNRRTDSDWKAGLPAGWQRRRMENFTFITAGIPQAEDMVGDAWTSILSEIGLPSGGKRTVDPDELLRVQMRRMEGVRRRIAATVRDSATAEALKPWFHYFCKRPGFSDNYLEVYNRPNVTLVDTAGKGVERIIPGAVVVAGHEYPVDCLVLATGFDFMTEYTREAGFDFVGRGGLPLSRHWSTGARTLFGMQSHHFPNLFMLSLMQAGISLNYTHTAEEQARHIAHVIGHCLRESIATVEPTAEAEQDWVERVVAGSAARRAFLDACTPSYYNYEGRRERAFQQNDPFPGGPIVYFESLAKWRAAGALSGLILARE